MKEHLVLLPGLGANEDLFKHQCEYLTDVCNPTVFNLGKYHSRKEMVEAVLKNAPQRFVLCGQSMGGRVAQHIAALAPERVTKLILINTWSHPDPKLTYLLQESLKRIEKGEFETVLKEHLARIVHPSRLNDLHLLTILQGMLVKLSLESYVNQMRSMADEEDTHFLLSKISCPTLIIHGREDGLFSLEEQERMAAKIPASRLAIIEECGHLAPLERPHATTALMRFWLS